MCLLKVVSVLETNLSSRQLFYFGTCIQIADPEIPAVNEHYSLLGSNALDLN